jgi:hypothetical protein
VVDFGVSRFGAARFSEGVDFEAINKENEK